MFRNKNFIVGFPKIASHIIDNEVGGGGGGGRGKLSEEMQLRYSVGGLAEYQKPGRIFDSRES